MKEAIVHSASHVTLIDSPLPTPGPNQLLIKVHTSGSNPKDWKIPEWRSTPMNSGDDIAGTVHSVGEGVYEFKPGDRVAAFHEMRAPHGSFAEYAVAWQHTTFHIPEGLGFEGAATLPLAAMTSAVGLFSRMGLREPWVAAREGEESIPILIYGGASAVGAFAIQLATASNLHPIITVAGRGIPFVESLIDKSKGDAVIDYRKGDEAVVSGIRAALSAAGVTSEKVHYAYDAISENGSVENIVQVLEPNNSHVTTVLPQEQFARTKGFTWPAGVSATQTMVGCVHDKEKDFGYVHFRYLARLIAEGKLKPHPYEVIPGGLAGVAKGLTNLKEGRTSASKNVFRVQETEGAGKD